MKKFFISGIAAVMLFTVTACGGDETEKTIDVSAVATEIIDSVELSSMVAVDSDRLSAFYDIDVNLLDGYALYISGSGGYADEIAIFDLADTSYSDDVTSAVNARIEQRISDFEDYVPEEAEKLRSHILTQRGDYIFLAVTPDNATAEGIFNEAFE